MKYLFLFALLFSIALAESDDFRPSATAFRLEIDLKTQLEPSQYAPMLEEDRGEDAYNYYMLVAAEDVDDVVERIGVVLSRNEVDMPVRVAATVTGTREAVIARKSLEGEAEISVVGLPERRAQASATRWRQSGFGSWGTECTTYQYGNTHGVRCRSW